MRSPAIIFKYNPDQMPEEEILSTFVGRDDLLNDIYTHIRKQRTGEAKKHLYFYGPRGIGKTSLLRVVQLNIQRDIDLKQQFLAVKFNEEERRITNLQTFAIRTLELISRVMEEAKDYWERAKSDPNGAFDLLIEFGKRDMAKSLVLLIDNFDDLAIAMTYSKSSKSKTSPSKKELVQKLLTFISIPNFILIAVSLVSPASSTRSKKFPKEIVEHFQQPRRIEPLSEAMQLLLRRAKDDKREDFYKELQKKKARVDGLNRLADGNPRLLVFLYDCLGEGPLPELVDIVQRNVDELTPMYQDVLDRLVNRGQAAVLDALASSGGVGTSKEMSEKTFQDEQTCRTALNDLCHIGLVTRRTGLVIPGEEEELEQSGKNTVYRLYPPLFQVWYEMRHLGSRKGLFLVRFFSLLAEPKDIRSAYQKLMNPEEKVSGKERNIVDLFADVADVLDPDWNDIRERHVYGKTLQDALASLTSELENDTSPIHSIGLLVQRSDVQAQLGRKDAAHEDLAQAKTLIADNNNGELHIKWLLGLSRLHYVFEEASESLSRAEKSLRLCNSLDSGSSTELKIQSHIRIAAALSELLRAREALEHIALGEELVSKNTSTATRAHLFLTKGNSLLALGRNEDARTCYGHTASISREIGDRRLEAAAVGNIGIAYMSNGENVEGTKHLNDALQSAKEMGDRRQEGGRLLSLGFAKQLAGKLDEAVQEYEVALKVCEDAGSKEGSASVLLNLGIIYAEKGEVKKAIHTWLRSLSITETVDFSKSRFRCLLNLLKAYHGAGQLDKREEVEQMLEQSLKGIDGRQIYAQLADMYGKIGDSEKAIEYLTKGLMFAREHKDIEDEKFWLSQICNSYLADGQIDKAVHYCRRGVDISIETEDRQGEAEYLTALGKTYASLDEPEKAIEHFERAILIFREIGNRCKESNVYEEMGLLYSESGDYARAISFMEQALEISVAVGDRKTESTSLANLGVFFSALGDTSKALNHQKKALTIAKEIGNPVSEGIQSLNIGNTMLTVGETSQAMDFAERAFVLGKEISNQAIQANALGLLGSIAMRNRRFDEAYQKFSEALGIFKTNGDSKESFALLNKCDAVLSMVLINATGNKRKEANKWLEEFLEIAKSEPESEIQLNILIRYKDLFLIPYLREHSDELDFLKNSTDRLWEEVVQARSLTNIFQLVLNYYISGKNPKELETLGPAETAIAEELLRAIEGKELIEE